MPAFSFPAVAVHLVLTLCAQDPAVVAPQAYKHQFENNWVKVVRVHYAPRERIASHDHPANNTVYVYLRDSGPVRFKHTGHEKFEANRPAVKAGGFRLGAAANETHEVESLSDQPTDFLRVELKTAGGDRKTFRGRYPPDRHRKVRSSERVRFENAQVRIVAVTCAARSRCGDPAPSVRPSLLVAITRGSIKMAKPAIASNSMSVATGQTIWAEAGDLAQVENTGNGTVEFLRIEFKTKPAGNP